MEVVKEYMREEGLLVDYSSEGLDNIADRATAEGRSAAIVIPGGLPDVRPLLRKGFWPREAPINSYCTYLYTLYGDNPDLPKPVKDNSRILKHASYWVFEPVGILREYALANADGLRLGFIAPDMVYPSGRPVTDMSLFRNAKSNRIEKEAIVNGKCVIEGREWNVIAVTRYAKGMSRSLFYEDEVTPSGFCGTFYYGEPSSTTYLAYQRALVAFNKTDAMVKLLGGREYFYNSEYYQDMAYTDVEKLLIHASGAMQRSLNVKNGSVEYYVGGKLGWGLYAAEDGLDQPLCIEAAKAGYDIVILESMIGSFQVVTEVLDVRTRHDSFLSLVYTY